MNTEMKHLVAKNLSITLISGRPTWSKRLLTLILLKMKPRFLKIMISPSQYLQLIWSLGTIKACVTIRVVQHCVRFTRQKNVALWEKSVLFVA